MTRAILIDPADRSFTEVHFSTWKEIAPLLGCELFDVVRFDGCSAYVDDEGLLKDPSDIRWTVFDGRPLAGSLLLVGHPDEEGADTDCPLSVEDAEMRGGFGRPLDPEAFVASLLAPQFVPVW